MPIHNTDAVLKALGIAREKVTVPAVAATPAPDVNPIVQGRTLREAIELNLATYSNPPMRAGVDPKNHRPGQRVVGQRRTELQILAEAFGPHKLTSEISDRDAGRLVEALRSLPQHWRQNPALGGGSIFDKSKRSMELKLPPLKTNTINGHVSTWRALFAQEKRGGHVASNPFEGKDVPAQGDSAKREGFTKREVGTIFASATFQGCRSPQSPFESGDHLLDDWRFWLPLIGVFTGARVAEIAQLRPEDVTDAAHEDVQGKWFIAIGRRTKNENSVRHVPVHPDLVRIGLVRLKQRMTDAGAELLLPNIPAALHGDDHGHFPGRWVRDKLLPRLGLKDAETGKGRGLGMHAFRHTLATLLAAGGASDDEIGRILGHVDDMQTHRYGQRLEASVATMGKLVVVPEIGNIRPRLSSQKQGSEKVPDESIDRA